MYTKPRLPDPVRTAAVRALVIVAVTLVQLMIAVLCSLAAVWLAFPMVISTVASTVVATWAVLDVWVTRQVWRQRHGVLSEPSSAARTRPLAARARRENQGTADRARNEG
jgi:transposase